MACDFRSGEVITTNCYTPLYHFKILFYISDRRVAQDVTVCLFNPLKGRCVNWLRIAIPV